MAKGTGKLGKVAVWIILALLIVGLAGFGATNFGGGVQSIGRVGDTEIPVNAYARALNQEMQAFSARTGEQFSFAQAQQFGIDQAVLQRVIARTALVDETDRIGLSVGDAEVARQVREIPAFGGLDGGFDPQSYRLALENAGLEVAEFERQLRADTASGLLRDAVSGGIETPDSFVDTLYAHARERRDLTWVRLGRDDLTEPLPEPSQEQLQSYYDANPEAFTLPETRAVTYARLTPEMLAERIEIDEDDLRAAYEERRDDYVQPERRLVERLVFPNEADAADAARAIAAGETAFDTLVADRGLSLEDVDLGEVTEADLGEAGQAVFATDEPGVVGPELSALGPALFRVNAILNAQETTFEEARADLRAGLAADRARREVDARRAAIEDLLAGGATLEDLAEETAMQLGRIDWRPGIEEGIAGAAPFAEAVRRAEVGDFPELTELPDGGVFALRLDEILPPRLEPLDEVRDKVAQAWRDQEAARRLTARAEDLKAELEEGATLDALGVEAQTEEGLLRDAALPELPDGLIEAAFGMAPGDIAVTGTGAGAVLFRVDEVVPADASGEQAAAEKRDFAARAAQTIAQDMTEAFTRAVEADAGISIDQSALGAVHGQFH